MVLKETGVRLTAQGATGFLRTMGSATKAVADFGKEGNVVSKGIRTLGDNVLGVGKVLGGVFVAGVGAAAVGIGFATKEAISLESAFAGVVKTTDGLTDSAGNLTAEGAAMKQEFRDLAKETPIAIEELMAIGELGGQLGIAKEDLIDFTETIAAMGVATNLTTEEAAIGFAQMANIMGTPSEEIENMASAIVALGNDSETTERDIFNFATRIAGAGNIAGLTEAQVFGIAGAFSSVGIEAAAGGTAVQKVLLSINEAVLTGGDNMETFASVAGISADDFGAAWEEDAGAVFTQFVEGLGIAGDEAVGILSDLGLEDQRLIKAFLSLSGAGDSLAESIDLSTTAYDEHIELMKEAGTRYATTESQIAIFKNTLRDVGFTIGGIVVPFLQKTLEALTPLANAFNFLIQGDLAGFFEGVGFAAFDLAQVFGATKEQAAAFSELVVGLIESLITAKDSIVAFAAPIVEWIGEKLPLALAFVTEHSVAFKGALIGIGVVLAGAGIISAIAGIVAALNPVTLVIGAIIAVAALLGAAWSTNWGGIQEKTQAVIDFIVPIIQEFLANIQAWWAENGEAIMATVQAAFEFISNVVTTVLDAIQQFWSEHGEAIIALLTAAWELIKTIFSTAFEFISGVVTTALENFQAWWSEHGEQVTEIISALWEGAQALFETFVEIFTNIFEAFRAAFEGDWTAFGENIREAWDAAWELIKEAAGAAVQFIKDINWSQLGVDIITGIKAGVVQAASILIDAVVAAAEAAIEAVKGFLGIGSPSKLFAVEVGETIPEGTALGVIEKSFLVKDAIKAMVDPMAMDSVSPVASASQQVSNVNNSRELTINFEGNYASQPAVRDSNDLSLVLGLAGVSA